MTNPMAAAHTQPAQLRDAFLVAWSALGVVLPCLAPNMGPIVLALSMVLPVLMADRSVLAQRLVRIGPVMAVLAAIVLYLCLNLLIAPVSDNATGAIFTIALAGLACHVCASAFPGMSSRDLKLMARGLVIGCLLAGTFLAIEYISRMSLQRAIQSFADAAHLRFVRITTGTWEQPSFAYLSRNLIVLVMLMWGAFACARASATPQVRQVIGPVLFLMVAGSALASPSATAKAGTFLGVVFWFLARRWTTVAARLVYAGWLIASLLCIPIAQLIHGLRLYDVVWINTSLRHRMMIWSASSEWYWQNPLFGLGIGGARKVNLNDGLNLAAFGIQGEPLNWHAHNIFVQAWFETGAVGGVLLSLFGLVLLRAIFQLPEHVRAYAVATFVSIFVVGLTGFSLWAAWYLAGYGIAALSILVVVFTNRQEPPLQGRGAG